MSERKYQILLVEDEEHLHEALKLNLELEGYEVSSAMDGKKALDTLQNAVFALIILVSLVTPAPNKEVQELIDHVRYPTLK